MDTTKSFKLLRLLSGKSIKEVAAACHVSTATVHDAERRNRTINTDNGTFLNRYLEWMDVPLSVFVWIACEVGDYANEVDYWYAKENLYDDQCFLKNKFTDDSSFVYLGAMNKYCTAKRRLAETGTDYWSRLASKVKAFHYEYIKLI